MTVLGCGWLNYIVAEKTLSRIGVSDSPISRSLDAIELPNNSFIVGRVAGTIDIKAKSSPSAELGIGLILVSHGPLSLDT